MATTTLRPTQGPSVPTSSRTEAVRSDAGARLPIPPTHTRCADRPNEMRGADTASRSRLSGLVHRGGDRLHEVVAHPLIVPRLLERLRVPDAVSYTHLRAHETVLDLVCRLL